MSELPEPWGTAAEKVGVRQTYRGIGDAAGLSHVTVRRLIAEGRTSPTTISKVASALRLDEVTVYEWAGIELSDWGVWNPPAEAHRLNPRARAALEELIRAVTQDGGSGDMLATPRLRRRRAGRCPRVARQTCSTYETRQSGSRSKTIRPWPHATNASMER